MEHRGAVQTVAQEIEHLTRMHILYGLESTLCFEQQKDKITDIIISNRINPKSDLDTVSRNLYRRYFG